MGIFNWLNKKAKVSNKARSSKNFEILRGSPEISVDIKKKIDLLSKEKVCFSGWGSSSIGAFGT